jgi:Family of unknown function (DUF6141)
MEPDQKQGIIFREVQYFRQWWVWLLVIAVVALAWWAFIVQIIKGVPFGDRPAPDAVVWIIAILIGMALPLLFLTIRMITEVRKDRIRIRYIPLYTRIVKPGEIKTFEACRFRPIRDYGGWGIRWAGSRGMAYIISGNEGVRLELTDGKKLMIGSQKAEELASAIRKAMGR